MTRWLPLMVMACAGLAHAAKDDRNKPIGVKCDQAMQLNLLSHRSECSGPVLLTQGSLQLHASRLEFEQRGDGSTYVLANGRPSEPVSFVQALDRPGETMEGQAERIEYDDRAETVRFVGAATVRTRVGTRLASELSGAALIYNMRSEILQVEPGQTSPQADGRVRILMMPKGASAPEAPASTVPLQTAPALAPKPK